VGDALRTTMDDSLVYRKSGLGAAQLAATHGRALSPPERCVLILMDGRRTIAELSDFFGAEVVQRLVPGLETKGFAKQVDPLAADWGAVTQLHVPAAEPPRPAPDRRSDGHPLVWIALATVLAIGGSYWATNRYRSQADAGWRMQTLAQVLPIDRYGLPTSTDAVNASGPEHSAPVTITPISRRPAVTVLKSAAATSLTRAAPQIVARDRPVIARTESRRPSPVHATASAVPVADFAAASAVRVALPATQSLPPQVATAAGTSGAPAAPPADAQIAAPAPLPAASAPQTVVAMQAPPVQPASNPLTLRPLRNDPPQFPERALRDGIVQSQVRAHLWVTPEGKVDQVDIVEASPPGVFDDEVRRALSLWTFEPPGRPTEKVIDLTLKP
jgi:TonB family protein